MMPIALLIGRDLLEAHRVHDHRFGPKDEPFALKMKLGWVIVGGKQPSPPVSHNGGELCSPGSQNGGETNSSLSQNGGEARSPPSSNDTIHVKSRCMEIDKDSAKIPSYAKIMAVTVYHKDDITRRKIMYAILDDQSNRSLVSKEFFDFFEIESQPINYSMSTCSGQVITSGRKATGFIVEPSTSVKSWNFPNFWKLIVSQITGMKYRIPR